MKTIADALNTAETKLVNEMIHTLNQIAIKRLLIVATFLKDNKTLDHEIKADILAEATIGLRLAIQIETLHRVEYGMKTLLDTNAARTSNERQIVARIGQAYQDISCELIEKFEQSETRFHNMLDAFKSEFTKRKDS